MKNSSRLLPYRNQERSVGLRQPQSEWAAFVGICPRALLARGPLRRVAAERHRRSRPEGGRFRQLRGVADCVERPKAGPHLLDKGLDCLALQVFRLQAIGHTAEIPEPSSGLRQRYADVPAAALA